MSADATKGYRQALLKLTPDDRRPILAALTENALLFEAYEREHEAVGVNRSLCRSECREMLFGGVMPTTEECGNKGCSFHAIAAAHDAAEALRRGTHGSCQAEAEEEGV